MKIDLPENVLSIVNWFSLVSLVFGLIEGDPIMIEIKVVVGGSVSLPCNVTNTIEDDSVTLILWYKEGTGGQPIYTMDSRTNLDFTGPQVFTHQLLGNRATFQFNKSSVRGSLLTIDPVINEDNGNYKCRVDFRRGRTQVTNVNLFVIVPPEKISIINNNDDGKEIIPNTTLSFNENTNVNLVCQSSGGRPSPSLIWYFNEKLLDDDYHIADSTISLVENHLTIPSVDRKMLNSILSCKASNNNITVGPTIAFILDLNIKPSSVEITNSREPISAGRKIEITCLATGSRPPARIVWLKEDKLMVHSRESYSTDGLVTTSALILMPTRDDNHVNIICKADNPRLINSTIQDSWILEVYYDPRVILSMGNATKAAVVKVGDRVEFDCNVSANPMVHKVSWFRDGQPLIKHARMKQVNTTLVIERSIRRDHGRYQCSAINIEGENISNVFHLEVHYQPACKKDQRNVYGVSLGEKITIPCQVEASPDRVDFYWLFNGSIVHDNQSLGLKYISEGLTSWLEYKVKSKEDYGIFECWSRNAIGSQIEPCLFTLIPSGPPEPPQACTIANRSETRLQVSCLPGYDGGSSQNFNLQVLNNRKQVLQNITTSSEPVIFNISDLNPKSSYTLILYSSNLKGLSKPISLVTSTLPVSSKNDNFNLYILDSEIMSAVRLGLLSALILITIVIIIGVCIKKHRKFKNTTIHQLKEVLDESLNENQITDQNNCIKAYTPGQINPDVVPLSKDNFADPCISGSNHFNDYLIPSNNQMFSSYNLSRSGSQGYGINFADEKLYPIISNPEIRASHYQQVSNIGNSIFLNDLSTRNQLLPRRSLQYSTNLRQFFSFLPDST
ncbi:nephrin-like isoform X2 [Tetranychus urticae]|uniref:nephrin-like isoform X2 n=1 Tax=Tetranychus urticae TaxID=32264 RepID=UPI000D64C09A|nr:nephrin-like isoform X2 [Tetranychus urticae]